MDLLFQSKRAWLLPFLIFLCITTAFYELWYDKDWVKTICLMMSAMLAGMAVCFLLIIIFKWTTWIRRVLILLYIGFTVYCWIKGYIHRWYVIIPSCLIMCFFMLWNLGGVKNCIIASYYKRILSNLGSRVNAEYDEYSSGLDRYNIRNNFGFFTKVRKKRRVNTARYSFNSSGLDMFVFEDAMFGVSTIHWKSKVEKLNKKLGRISDKNGAIYADETISDEYNNFREIRQMGQKMGYHNSKQDEILDELRKIKKKGIKKQKKILRKRI